jgi:PadR family transcriptional regulator PadR
MARLRKPSAQAADVLAALRASPAGRYGTDLEHEAGLRAGSLYPILMRLADRGLLETSWKPEPQPGRRSRHLYRLTAAGQAVAAAGRPLGESPGGPRPTRWVCRRATLETGGRGATARTRASRRRTTARGGSWSWQ